VIEPVDYAEEYDKCVRYNKRKKKKERGDSVCEEIVRTTTGGQD